MGEPQQPVTRVRGQGQRRPITMTPDGLYNDLDGEFQKQIDWYNEKANNRGIWSRRYRLIAIILATMGALWTPILALRVSLSGGDGESSWSLPLTADLEALGYLLIAVAAAIIGGERFFGISSSWMRYRKTQQTLQKRQAEFRHNWMLHQCTVVGQPTPTQLRGFVEIYKAAETQLNKITEEEMDAWIEEMMKSISLLMAKIAQDDKSGVADQPDRPNAAGGAGAGASEPPSDPQKAPSALDGSAPTPAAPNGDPGSAFEPNGPTDHAERPAGEANELPPAAGPAVPHDAPDHHGAMPPNPPQDAPSRINGTDRPRRKHNPQPSRKSPAEPALE